MKNFDYRDMIVALLVVLVLSLISDAPSINPSGIVQDVIKSYSDELELVWQVQPHTT